MFLKFTSLFLADGQGWSNAEKRRDVNFKKQDSSETATSRYRPLLKLRLAGRLSDAPAKVGRIVNAL